MQAAIAAFQSLDKGRLWAVHDRQIGALVGNAATPPMAGESPFRLMLHYAFMTAKSS